MIRVLLVAVGWLGLLVASVEAQTAAQLEVMKSDRRTVTTERLRDDERIVLDGVLDEAVWSRAVHAGEFVMQDPILGNAPTERTEVRFAFNRDHLYMGVINFDSEPDKLQGNTKKRDEFLSADDRFMWTMDTFLNQQTGYFFEMNPAGLMADALMGPGGTNNREWDGIWNARVRQSEIGWVIEIDIPFRSLAFDPNAPAWGINFQRTVRRKQEELLWTGIQRNQGLRRMANAGLLVGLQQQVSEGRGFEVRPYSSGYLTDGQGRTPPLSRTAVGDVGVDVAYNITPSLRGVATVNTDFAETEVDLRRVNLTRFPIFFPERRTFFLDGATFFDFPVTAFFSRRVGLVNGEPQPIVGGGKLTGQAGRSDIGALYVRTAEQNATIGEHFLVGRVRRRLFEQSYVGAIYTGRDDGAATEKDMQHTAGIDFRLATRRFRGTKNLNMTGYYVRNSSSDERGSAAYGVSFDYPNDIWELGADFQEVQPGYDPAVGFVPRRDFRRYAPDFRWNPRPRGHRYIRRMGMGVRPSFFTDLEGRKESIYGDIQLFRMELHSGDNWDVSVTPTYERLKENFTIAPGVVLPSGGEYEFIRYQVQANTANRRVVALRPRFEWGTFFSGRRTELELGVDVRPMSGVRVNTTYEYNRVSLAEGTFDTRLWRVVADTQVSPFLFLVNNVQYDSVSRIMGWQSRMRWIVTPGNDVFFVYTHNWLDTHDPLDPHATRFSTLDRRAAAKVVYTRRF